MSKNLFSLSDEQWKRIEPHLPTKVRGKKRKDGRVDATIYMITKPVHGVFLTYRHTEIQRWEVIGQPTPPSGFPRDYRVHWTVSGNGARQVTGGAAVWTISGAADVQFRAQVIGSGLRVARVDPNTKAPYGVAGVEQLVGMNPGPIGAARDELGYTLMSAQMNPTSIMASTNPVAGIWGFRQGGDPVATGTTWNCQWNFVL